MILLIDNYDSFTYNLVQALGSLGHPVTVLRNDSFQPEDLKTLHWTHLVVSPGPGGPADAGRSNDAIRLLSGSIPVLGVCLGHQCLAHVYGARILRAPRLMHGKTSQITHQGTGLFQGVPNPFLATRYHSLIVDPDSLPDDLIVDAQTPEGEIMALRHRTHPTFGVQFHPESFLTEHGDRILANFLGISSS